ncbi:MAG: leucine-rich repeat domain-containing protein, partial [Lachnospiraceae bacterium]|nr:leucine-rich repeat domain-containing protein [Lachnospiraceae bacterium]
LEDTELTEIKVDPDNAHYEARDGVLYSASGILIAYPVGKSGPYAIPEEENIWGIQTRAFLNCRQLTELTIPKNITKIGENVFYNCSLTEISISEDCELMGDLGSEITVNRY